MITSTDQNGHEVEHITWRVWGGTELREKWVKNDDEGLPYTAHSGGVQLSPASIATDMSSKVSDT